MKWNLAYSTAQNCYEKVENPICLGTAGWPEIAVVVECKNYKDAKTRRLTSRHLSDNIKQPFLQRTTCPAALDGVTLSQEEA